MPRKVRVLRADLRREGFTKSRQTGGHETWIYPDAPGVAVYLAGHDSADAKDYQKKRFTTARSL